MPAPIAISDSEAANVPLSDPNLVKSLSAIWGPTVGKASQIEIWDFRTSLGFGFLTINGFDLSLRRLRLFSGVSVCCSSCRKRRLINSAISPPETFEGI